MRLTVISTKLAISLKNPYILGMSGLTKRQEAFVLAYMGEAKGIAYEAAKLAGYKGNRNTLDVTASNLLRNPKVAAKIAELSKHVRKVAVVDRERRVELLSQFAQDENLSPKDRMKAMELLGKMSGDFIERRQVEGHIKYENTRKELRDKLNSPDLWEQLDQLSDDLLETELDA